MGLQSSQAPSLRSPGSRLTVRLSVFMCLWCLCVPFTCAAAARSHSSHPCPPLQSPISRLQAPIFLPGAGEAAQRGPDLFPTHPPKVSALPCPASSPPVQADGLAAWQAGELSKNGGGEAAASPRALLPTHPQACQSSSRARSFEPPERGLHLSPPPSFQEDCGSEARYSGTDDPSQREPWLAAGDAASCCDRSMRVPAQPHPPSPPSTGL